MEYTESMEMKARLRWKMKASVKEEARKRRPRENKTNGKKSQQNEVQK